MTTTATSLKPASHAVLPLEELRNFIEAEADLLDQQRYQDWVALYAEDCRYWAPAQHGQESPSTHVSLFYDEKHHLKTRIQRLLHPMLHCQDPKSHCVRMVSSVAIEWVSDDRNEYRVRSKFLMLEDRVGADRRFFGGRYTHTLRRRGESLEIVEKRIDITNCDHSFPMLTQPF